MAGLYDLWQLMTDGISLDVKSSNVLILYFRSVSTPSLLPLFKKSGHRAEPQVSRFMGLPLEIFLDPLLTLAL